jgi:serine/threonine protein kinase
MSSRTLTNVVNDQTVALNALIYGYAGHSLVTPQHALQQVWWTEERINEKVTTEFITSRLRPNERERLHRPVAFGDLTDDTYMEWILEKARRLFLILAEVGEADIIFGVVDRSWDDDDLPLQMDDIEDLALSNRRDEQANARFYHTQFTFLLRELREGVHIDYASNEEIPIEYVISLPPAVSLQNWSRIHLPKKQNEIYVRRKFSLGNPDTVDALEDEYLMDVDSAKMVEHDHIVPVWASYTAKGFGYVLTNFVAQHTLRSFIDHRNPAQYQRLPKPSRRHLLLNWLHCLADAVVTLHQNGFCHSAIRPSNILIDENNHIAFSDIGCLETFQRDKKHDPMDAYVYGAPETQNATNPLDSSTPSPTIGTTRKPSSASKSSSGSANSNSSQRQKLTKASTNDFSGFNFGFRKDKQPVRQRPRIDDSEQADVYSLGCVFLEIVTFMLKKKSHEFIKHRSSKQKVNAGGKNSRLDSSYHANLARVELWMKALEDLSLAQEDDAFRAVPYLLNLIRSMLGKNPHLRPSARDVRDRILEILLGYTSINNIHCRAHKFDFGAATSNSGSDRASSISSFRVSSISSASSSTSFCSDASTVSSSTSSSVRVSSILNSYSDRSTLAGIRELDDDDSASILTIVKPVSPYVNTSYGSPRTAPVPPSPPESPGVSPRSPISPMSQDLDRAPSPSSAMPTHKVKLWSKPFLLLP